MIDIWGAVAVMTGTCAHGAEDWRAVHDFWFPPGLDDADPDALRRQVEWWFGGGSNGALPPFAPVLEAARAGRLDGWAATPLGRLSLIVVLDQFPRGLFAGTPDAYASDPAALRIAEEGLGNGHHAALAKPWERMFSVMPLVHAEGPGHRERLERVVALAERIAREVPEPLRPLHEFSAGQARGHRDVIRRFGRYPHRNPVLGRPSTPEEEAYLAKGDFVHQRRMPAG
ncbi:DUF924 family protein [Craurococcus roseus]|uniref:DUF924 family protein n=1 Tax=Craurococcus roseus TaxID=77585 RepID=A0ABN1FG90_9PROT